MNLTDKILDEFESNPEEFSMLLFAAIMINPDHYHMLWNKTTLNNDLSSYQLTVTSTYSSIINIV